MTPDPDSRVILLVLDGLRPDRIDPAQMPNISRLRGAACCFPEARTVFPSMTRTAAASLATGTPPARHGVIGNAFYAPGADAGRITDLSSLAAIETFEARSGTPLLGAPSFAERVTQAGLDLGMVHAGGAASAYLLAPPGIERGHWVCALAAANAPTPPPELRQVTARFGPVPASAVPDIAATRYAADVFVDQVLERMRPRLAVLWLNEPDKTWHFRGFASDDSAAALTAADAAVGQVLDWLEARPDRDAYTLILTSDHGHVTVSDEIELHALLSNAGHACRHMIEGDLGGDALAVTGWTYGGISVRDGDPNRLRDVAAWLQTQPYIGALFSSGGADGVEGTIPGTFSLDLVEADHPRQAELLFTTTVRDDVSADGWTGAGPSIGGRKPPRLTMHGGLSRTELRHTLIARGPDFAAGAEDRRPAGIVDVAPTILAILGVTPAAAMTGQVLFAPAPDAESHLYETAHGAYRQSLHVISAGRARYVQAGGRDAFASSGA